MEEYVKVAVLENEIEAQVLDSILNDRNIPHIINSYFDLAYDGLFQAQKGWGCVKAPQAYRLEILEILADLREGKEVPECP